MENRINVLVPTDFSRNAGNALEYGLSFIRKFNSSLYLLHVYEPYEISSEVPVFEVIEKQNEEKKVNIKNQLEVSRQYVERSFPDLDFSCIISKGDASDEIVKTAEKRDIDLIIMGRTEKSPINRFFFGNITNKVIEKSPCPALIVPPNVPFREIRRVAYASGLSGADIPRINQLSVLAGAFDASIEVIHVFPEEKSDKELNDFEAETRKYVPYGNMRFLSVPAHEVEAGIEEYCSKNQLDLLAMSIHTRTRMENFYNPAITEYVSEESPVPMLIFHLDKEDR